MLHRIKVTRLTTAFVCCSLLSVGIVGYNEIYSISYTQFKVEPILIQSSMPTGFLLVSKISNVEGGKMHVETLEILVKSILRNLKNPTYDLR